MRRIVTFNRVSADGYFAAPDGNLDWVVPEPALDRAVAEGLSGHGTIVFGRRTYEMFEGFWPHVLEDAGTAPDPHDARRRSPELRAMAVWINEATKIVFSRTRKDVAWQGSRLLRTVDPEAIEALKRESGPDILIFGSASIVSQFTQHGLIDEYHLLVSPILLGSGRSWLNGASTVRLDLRQAAPYPSGNVMLRYARRIP